MRKYLNIGCGNDYKESNELIKWINVDFDTNVKADYHCDILHLATFPDFHNADYILAQDVLEHIPYGSDTLNYWHRALKQWWDCLNFGGTIQIQVPDPYLIFKQLENGEISEEEMNRLIFGENTNAGDRHYQLISQGRLKQMMVDTGYYIERMERSCICSIIVGRKK